jgi:hypothetical protein
MPTGAPGQERRVPKGAAIGSQLARGRPVRATVFAHHPTMSYRPPIGHRLMLSSSKVLNLLRNRRSQTRDVAAEAPAAVAPAAVKPSPEDAIRARVDAAMDGVWSEFTSRVRLKSEYASVAKPALKELAVALATGLHGTAAEVRDGKWGRGSVKVTAGEQVFDYPDSRAVPVNASLGTALSRTVVELFGAVESFWQAVYSGAKAGLEGTGIEPTLFREKGGTALYAVLPAPTDGPGQIWCSDLQGNTPFQLGSKAELSRIMPWGTAGASLGHGGRVLADDDKGYSGSSEFYSSNQSKGGTFANDTSGRSDFSVNSPTGPGWSAAQWFFTGSGR